MSKARNANSRRAVVRERRRREVESGRVGYSDAAFGIEVRRMRPGGGAERLQVRWNVDRDPFLVLMSLERLRTGPLRGLELDAVEELRESGASWADIGFALNISGEAARLRFRSEVEPSTPSEQ